MPLLDRGLRQRPLLPILPLQILIYANPAFSPIYAFRLQPPGHLQLFLQFAPARAVVFLATLACRPAPRTEIQLLFVHFAAAPHLEQSFPDVGVYPQHVSRTVILIGPLDDESARRRMHLAP